MAVLEVPLQSSRSGLERALLRELSGREEVLAARPNAAIATELLGRLLLGGGRVLDEYRPNTDGDVWSLSVSDRDHLIAALYLHWYGDHIDATVACRACQRGFALGCSLRELVASVPVSRPSDVTGPDESGVYALPGGLRFRVPTTADERAALDGRDRSEQLLLGRCVLGEPSGLEQGAIERALASLAPLLSFELTMVCPHCAAQQDVRFDVTEFFLSTLMREQPLLTREIHYLASAYHWSRAEILDLPRTERRRYVALVLAERSPELAES